MWMVEGIRLVEKRLQSAGFGAGPIPEIGVKCGGLTERMQDGQHVGDDVFVTLPVLNTQHRADLVIGDQLVVGNRLGVGVLGRIAHEAIERDGEQLQPRMLAR